MSKYPIPAKALEQNILVLGKTRSGKSSAMRSIVEPLLDSAPVQPPCIIDPKGDWWGLKSGYEIVIFGGNHADVPLTEHMGRAIAHIVATSSTPVLLDLSELTVGQRTRFFVEFAAEFFRAHRGQRKLIIDEVHNFAPQGKVFDPQSGLMLHWANRLASEGSGRGITLMAASQRPQKVHKDFATSMETLIAMRVIHKLDRDAIKDWIDGCGDPKTGKDMLTSIANLKRGTGWVWSPEIEFGPELVHFPLFRSYDSFKPQPAEIDVSDWRHIQVDEIREQLAGLVHQAEEDDPKVLRKRIAELEAKLKSRTSTATLEDMRQVRDDAFQQGLQVGLTEAHTLVVAKTQEAVKLFEAIELKARQSATEISIVDIPEPAPPQSENPIVPPQAMTKRLHAGVNAAIRAHAASDISPAARKILDVIHRTYPMWISFDAAARRAGISKASSAYRKYWKQVRASGEVEEGKDGKLRSWPQYAVDGPINGGLDAWVSKLTPSYGAMLRAIADHGGGRGITKDQIADLAGVSHTSSGLGAGLAELRRLELVSECNGLYTLADGL